MTMLAIRSPILLLEKTSGGRMAKNIFLVALIFIMTACSAANREEAYHHRYTLPDVYAKLVDNYGNGFEPLYGTRNFRAVLKGVAYRGGANNLYHRVSKRKNENPLPNDGLQNLCSEGFQTAVYLYPTNFSTAPKTTNCTSDLGNNSLNYIHATPFGDPNTYNMLKLVYETIVDPTKGPIYFHCWNGWHASGLISALMLRQFCDYSGDQAVTYWDTNTDGNNKDSSYQTHRTRIRQFVPYDDLKITEQQKSRICY